jgi:hypothetical protein
LAGRAFSTLLALPGLSMAGESIPSRNRAVETYQGLCTRIIRKVKSRLQAIYGSHLGLSPLLVLCHCIYLSV